MPFVNLCVLGMEEDSEARSGPQMPQPAIGFLWGNTRMPERSWITALEVSPGRQREGRAAKILKRA